MLRLNLGCGSDKRDGWVNLDCRTEVDPDVVHDIRNPLPYEAGSVDEILAKDLLEHVGYREVLRVLKDWFRVLKPNGKIYIQVPDMTAISQKILEGKLKGWWEISYWVYGGQEYGDNTHRSGFTIESLNELLTQVGFKVEKINNDGGSNILCWAVKP